MASQSFVTDVEFHDSDLFTTTAKEWQADFVQLDQGSFKAKIRQIGLDGTQLGEAYLSRSVHQAGLSPPGGRTFIIPKTLMDGFIWRSFKPSANQMLCFPYQADFESVSPAGFHIYGLSVPWWMIEERATALEYSVDASLHLGLECVEIAASAMARIRREMEELLTWLEPVAEGIPGAVEEYRERLDELITYVVAAWLFGSDFGRPVVSRKRERVLNSAMDFVRSHEQMALSVRDLCGATGVSERTLQYAFKEQFQVTPKQYLINRRLEGVRRELRISRDRSITELAQAWGFPHMGQFAARYRSAFGELPSQTRSRRR